MKRFAFLLVSFIAAALAVSCSRYETVKGDPMKSKIYTLDNGLKIYMTVNKEEPRIQTFVAVRVGAKNDPKETTGLAHYFEHLMFKGSEQFGTQDYEAEKPMLDEIERLFEEYRSISDPAERKAHYAKIDSVSFQASQLAIPNEYDKLMSMIGSRGSNAWTSFDETVYTEDIPSNQMENWAKIEADRFRHNVIRGFHTELETVYEEYNMSLTSDGHKMLEAVNKGLFPHHPYGTQTVLGTQEQLKNPSIVNIKRTYNTYYRPNNIAICLSGDFNPKEAVKIIDKYFGDWEPNPDIPEFKFEKEQPITEPVVKEVKGLQAEMLAMGWRLPGSSDFEASAVSAITSSILYNSQAGLIDIDINQKQKAMQVFAISMPSSDYSILLTLGMPKQGQTLDELKELTLEEIAKLRNGDFDESLIEATVNNIRLTKMAQLESNRARANAFVDAFIAGVDWKDAALELERYSKVSKEDIVAFANEYLKEDNYTIVYKRQGVDESQKKIEAPAITPIATNRDKRSAFLDEVSASEVTPIEPVFVDFNKDMSKFKLCEGVDVLYKHNELNDIAEVEYIFNRGTEDDPALNLAFSYIEYLGTADMSSEEIARKMYDLACSFGMSAKSHSTSIHVRGLSENLPEAVRILESLIANATPDEDILANCKADIMKMRLDNKSDQDECMDALERYMFYGPEFVKKTTISNESLMALSSEELLAKVREIAGKGHEILYYGPESQASVKKMLSENHKVGENPEPMEEKFSKRLTTESSQVLLAPYDSKQFLYVQYTDLGGKFDKANTAEINMYDEYFGGGMNSIVFQEMREARGLAYRAYAYLEQPSDPVNGYMFYAYIASQNDKLRAAADGFKEIIENMPVSESAFQIAKDGILSRMRTKRTTGKAVLDLYRQCRRLGLDEPSDKAVFEAIQTMSLEDVKAAQQKWVAGKNYVFAILGDPADLDQDFLKTLGPVKKVSLEEIFGY
ncbi:MAG: insulinase family protein [Bacteroidales bacterium]|nr:insulinase family protein [Bacteroidales bacterium]